MGFLGSSSSKHVALILSGAFRVISYMLKSILRSLDLEELGDRPVSLEILNGGRYYFVASAYTSVTNKPCAVASLRAKRSFDETTQQWTVKVLMDFRRFIIQAFQMGSDLLIILRL